jgi:hypothetical protein
MNAAEEEFSQEFEPEADEFPELKFETFRSLKNSNPIRWSSSLIMLRSFRESSGRLMFQFLLLCV